MMSLLVVFAAASKGVEGAILGPAGIVVAFFVGIVSFFTPCILPLVPGYLSYVSGLTGEEMDAKDARRRVLLGTSLFVLGFATMFTALGAAASLVGGFLLQNLTIMDRIAGVIVIVMGLAFLIPSLMPFMERERRPFLSRAKPGLAGAYPLGLAFAAGWTPCVGPGLSVMLTLGVAEGSALKAALLLFAFSMGFGMWFVLAGLGLRRAASASGWLHKRMRGLQLVGGSFMLIIGVLLVTNRWADVMAPLRRLINTFQPPI